MGHKGAYSCMGGYTVVELTTKKEIVVEAVVWMMEK